MPCYLPVMQYADRRDIRATLHRAYVTRASELGAKSEWDNTPVIARILALRREAAELLGYRNYAELSLVPKMANTADEVLAFLRDWTPRKPFASVITRAHGVCEERLGLTDFAPWDSPARPKTQASATRFPSRRCGNTFPGSRSGGLVPRCSRNLWHHHRGAKAATWHERALYVSPIAMAR
jgi:oligopeptidase A